MASAIEVSFLLLHSFSFIYTVVAQAFPNQPPFTTNLTTVNITYTPPQFRTNGSLDCPYYLEPQQRQIVYANSNGLAIIEGDIILGTVADVQDAVVNPSKLRARGISIQHTNRFNKWPAGYVLYKYESLEFENKRKEQFEAAIKLWTDRLPFLYFQKDEASEKRMEDGGAITLIPAPQSDLYTSWSPIGRAGWIDKTGMFQYRADSNVMTLADCTAALSACAAHYAHEIGHTLGLYHEHNRPDRDDNVVVHCARIPGYEGATKAEQDKLCSAYVKQDPAAVDFTGPYDRDSIMHYSTGLGYGINGQKIMEGIPPFPDPNPGLAPTKYDVLKICELYSEVCHAICGDGILSPGEKCDDGNNIDDDGCAANCQSYTNTRCGNGILDKGEACDLGPSNGVPGYNCGLDCKLITPEPPAAGLCGIYECNPNPGQNKCHITSSCIPIDGSPNAPRHLCACAHGFRGLGVSPGDTAAQVKIPAARWPSQKGRVFVNPGVVCSQLCTAWTLGADGCKEVQDIDACF